MRRGRRDEDDIARYTQQTHHYGYTQHTTGCVLLLSHYSVGIVCTCVLTCEIKVAVSDRFKHGFILVLFRFIEGGKAAEKDVCDDTKGPHIHLLPITRTTLLPRHIQNLRCDVPERGRRGGGVWEKCMGEGGVGGCMGESEKGEEVYSYSMGYIDIRC